MIKFERIIIDNFQSHHHTEICFLPGVNALVGPSDSGKSAILRALRWVLFNLPRGNDFIRVGSKECRVELVLTNQTRIIRQRGTTINRYVLIKPGEEEQIFEAFGNKTPQEILDAHQIRIARLDQKEIMLNLSTQLEAPFLLSESVGSKAKMIGLISGANLLDNALKESSLDRHSLGIDLKQAEWQQVDLQGKLSKYADLAEQEELLSQAEAVFAQIHTKNIARQGMANMVSRLYQISQERLFLKKQLEQQEIVRDLIRDLAKVEEKLLRYRDLARLSNLVERLDKSVSGTRQIITKYSSINKLDEVVAYLEEQLVSLLKIGKLNSELVALADKIKKGNKFCLDRKKFLVQKSDELAALMQQLQHCPFCGSTILGQHIEKVLAEYKGGYGLCSSWKIRLKS